MPRPRTRWLAAAAFAASAAFAAPATPRARAGKGPTWSTVSAPSGGSPRSIGSPSAGCVAGAARLPNRGVGYRVADPARGRVFGHPDLIAFIRDLAAKAHDHHLGLIAIGDLGQPRGGPAPSGHASHQNGLDVDIWYARPGRRISMVDAVRHRPSRRFGRRVIRILRLAATDPRVDRIFVNPVLKRALCKRVHQRAWLRKIRPWWKHTTHFHVRLACPDDSPACKSQAPIPPGDGCDRLAWWFRRKDQHQRKQQHQRYRSEIGSRPRLPKQCLAVLRGASAPIHARGDHTSRSGGAQ